MEHQRRNRQFSRGRQNHPNRGQPALPTAYDSLQRRSHNSPQGARAVQQNVYNSLWESDQEYHEYMEPDDVNPPSVSGVSDDRIYHTIPANQGAEVNLANKSTNWGLKVAVVVLGVLLVASLIAIGVMVALGLPCRTQLPCTCK